MRNAMTGLLTVVWFAACAVAAQASSQWVDYKPGALKAATERGETVLVNYKTTW